MLKIKYHLYLLLLVLFYSNFTYSAPVVLWSEDFESVTNQTPNSVVYDNNTAAFVTLDNNATINVVNSGCVSGSTKCVKAVYPQPIGQCCYFVWAGFKAVPPNTNHLFIEFDAKMPDITHGMKFVKVFGRRSDTTGYANTTFGLDYTGVDYGAMYVVSYDDGTNTENDTARVIALNGSDSNIGRAPSPIVLTPQNRNFRSTDWGTTWHHFRIYLKFNTGTTSQNEVANGEYYVEIDGLVYVWARQIFNKHPINDTIDRVEFFGWSQTGDSNPQFTGNRKFEMWYDNFKVSTNAFTSGPLLTVVQPDLPNGAASSSSSTSSSSTSSSSGVLPSPPSVFRIRQGYIIGH